jgi:hypothetical protein
MLMEHVKRFPCSINQEGELRVSNLHSVWSGNSHKLFRRINYRVLQKEMSLLLVHRIIRHSYFVLLSKSLVVSTYS